MGGADVGNAELSNESNQCVSGTVQCNKPRVVRGFPTGEKNLGCTFQSALLHTQIYGNEQCGLWEGCCVAGLA